MDNHFIYDHVAQGQLVIEYIPLTDQVVDALTKLLPSSCFLFHLKLLVLPPPIVTTNSLRELLALMILGKLTCT